MEKWQVKLIDSPMVFGTDLIIYRRHLGKVYIYKDNIVQEIPEGQAYNKNDVTLHLEPEMLQDLMDALHNMNVKPTEAKKTEGLLEAQTAHLQDLRKLLKLK